MFKNIRCVCLTLIFWLISLRASAQDVLDGVVAVVGDEIITRSELMQTVQGFALRMGINSTSEPEKFNELKKEMLQNLINEKVLFTKAIEDTITVDDNRVEAELDARIQNMVQQLGSKEKVEAQFGAPIKKIKRDYRDDIRKGLIVQILQEKKMAEVQISRREVENFYETMKDSLPPVKPMVKLRHILLQVKAGSGAREKAVLQLRDIQERLRNGEDFEELAQTYSEDPGSAKNGGNLGFVERGTLFQSFEEAAFQLKPEEVSDIVETPVGLHLIQMLEKRGDKVNVRHILIRLVVSDSDEEDVLKTAYEVRERAESGEDFEMLVQEYSDDETTKEIGGDLGWIPPDELQIEAFKMAVDTLEVGEISQPFQTQFGYHLVQVESKRSGRILSLQEDWEQIKGWAWNMKKQNVLKEWIEELKKEMFVDIKEDLI